VIEIEPHLETVEEVGTGTDHIDPLGNVLGRTTLRETVEAGGGGTESIRLGSDIEVSEIDDDQDGQQSQEPVRLTIDPRNKSSEPEVATGIEMILGAELLMEEKRKSTEVVIDALLIQEILASITHYFDAHMDDDERQSIIDLVVESIVNCDLNYGEKAAIEWGDGWKWKKEQIEGDMELYEQAGMDIKLMAANRLKLLKSDRLNPQRVESLRENNPERERLIGLCDGMRVPKPEGFIPNGATSKKGLHKVYKRVHAAVDKMLGDLHDQQLGFVLSEGVSREVIEHNRMLSKWARNKGKKCRLNIGDMSYGEKPYLNGKWAKNAAAEMWGSIELPTIEEIATMVLDYWEEVTAEEPDVQWSDLIMWKMDLKGA
jgi:hypothetical protein